MGSLNNINENDAFQNNEKRFQDAFNPENLLSEWGNHTRKAFVAMLINEILTEDIRVIFHVRSLSKNPFVEPASLAFTDEIKVLDLSNIEDESLREGLFSIMQAASHIRQMLYTAIRFTENWEKFNE